MVKMQTKIYCVPLSELYHFFTGLLDAACERQLTNLEMGP